jgi:DNA-binding MarR family transcriptional regulator
MPSAVPATYVETFREFNRFYTHRIGVLEKGLLSSSFTLTQARVLFELAQRAQASANEIGDLLGLDAGYLSRIVQGFADSGLITRKPSPDDRRRMLLSLTAAGKRAFERLDRSSRAQASDILGGLSPDGRDRLLSSMRSMRRLLAGAEACARGRVTIRTHRPGDIGWAIERHGRLYTDEYGLNEEFEALVATLVRRLRHTPRLRPRADVDRRSRRRARRLRFRGAERGRPHARPVALPAGRPQRTRPWHRPPSGGPMHRLRPRCRLPGDDAVDQRRAGFRQAHLRGHRFHAGEGVSPPQLRPRPGRPDMDTRPLRVCLRSGSQHQPAIIVPNRWPTV